MRCASCYTENPAWTTICTSCGGAVFPLEFCLGGHLLPPGVRECPICPSLWPEVSPFSGPPILRGLLRVERGRLSASDRPGALQYLEIRDREFPLVLAELPGGGLRLLTDDDPGATVRILMRPGGVTVCRRTGPSSTAGPPAYEPLPADQRLLLGEACLRFVAFEIPAWVETRAAR